MYKEKPLYERLYTDEAYIEVARLVNHVGVPFRELAEKAEPLHERFGVERVNAVLRVLTPYTMMTVGGTNPEARLGLRPEVRKLCWQLLGPPPEDWDRFYRNMDGTPTEQHAEKMAELAKLNGKPDEKKQAKRKRK